MVSLSPLSLPLLLHATAQSADDGADVDSFTFALDRHTPRASSVVGPLLSSHAAR